MRPACVNKVFDLAKRDPRVVYIGSDLSPDLTERMKTEMPGRAFMEGVSEAHVVGMAAGLAMEGFIPFVHTIATFITRRCYEQVAVDLCLHNLPVRLIGNGGGLVYAPLGPTHLAIEDISIFRALPNMTVVAVADAEEMRRFMPQTLDHRGPIYIRLAKGGDPVVTNDKLSFRIGKSLLMREGRDALLVTTGVTLKIALDAAEMLSRSGIEAAVLHMPTVKPLDEEAFLDHASRSRVIVAVEENTIIGGLGSALAEAISEAGFNPARKLKRIGVPDRFPDKYGSQANLLDYYGINAQQVAATVESLAGRRQAGRYA